MKKIYRSKNNRQLAGVCGGIAKLLNIDPTLIRLAWALITVFSVAVPGIIVYLICAIVIPEEPDYFDTTGTWHDGVE